MLDCWCRKQEALTMTGKTFETMTKIRNEWSIKGFFKKDYASMDESVKENPLTNVVENRR